LIRQPALDQDPETLALGALSWTLSDPNRAQRFLAITGIDPDGLRERLDDPAVLASCLQFLLANEADLLACADELGQQPANLARAAERLEPGR
jgi:hypothetical protein